MLIRSSCFVLISSACVLHCGGEDKDLLVGVESFTPDVESREDAVFGGLTAGDSCTAPQKNLIRDVGFVTRTIVGSPAFEACIKARVPAQYRRCVLPGGAADPLLTASQYVDSALSISRSVNAVAPECDSGAEFWGLANVGSVPGFYGAERFTYGRWSTSHADMMTKPACGLGQTYDVNGCRDVFYPENLSTLATTFVHENMHQHGYWHGSDAGACVEPGYNDAYNSMPGLTGPCVSDVIKKSMQVCGDICPTRSGDDISSCRTRGRLKVATSLSGSTCTEAWDPGLRHYGALRTKNGELVAADMLPLGQRFGGASLPPASHNDRFLAKGDFVPENPGEEMAFDYLTVTEGWYVAGWNIDATSAERSRFFATKQIGATLSHHGDGTGWWVLYYGDKALGAGRYSSNTQWGTTPPRDEILVRSRDGLGVLAVVSNTLVTRNNLSNGTTFPAASATSSAWTLQATDQFMAQGDFNGDGQLDIMLGGTGKIGVISRTGAGGTFQALDVRVIGDSSKGFWGNWNIGRDDKIVAVGNFVGDAREEVLIQSAWGVGLLGVPPGSAALRDYWGVPHATVLDGRWTSQAADQFLLPGFYFFKTNKEVLLRGSSGLATLRFSRSASGLVTPSLPHFMPASGGAWDDPDGGHWNYGHGSDQLMGKGDYNADGYDEFVVRNGWGIGIIGRTASSSALQVHDANPHGCGATSDVACHNALFGSWLSRDTDRVVTSIKSGSVGDLLILQSRP
jgi:hypothetical protein